MTIAAVYVTSKIRIRSNFSDLLPDDHPAVTQAKKLEQIVGGASFVVVAVENKNSEAAGRFLDDLKRKLEGTPGIRYIDDRSPTEFLRKKVLLYLSLDDLDRLKERIQRRFETAKLTRTHLYVDLEGEGDAFDTSDLQKKYATFLAPHTRYQNKDGTLVVSLIKPEWRTTDVSRTQEFLDLLHGLIRELHSERYDASLNVRLTGPYVKTFTQKKILLRDATVVSILSFAASIAYLIFHFRRKRAVTLIGVPLAVSGIWSISLAYFFFGSLNLFSSAACAILLGLAADYGIHLFSEYLHHRKAGEPLEEALVTTFSHLGRTFLVASSTTATAFFSLMFSRFKALYELGAIAGTGVILCALAFFIILPPLVVLIERWKPQRVEDVEWTGRRQRFSRHWMRYVFSSRNLIVTGLILLAPLLSLLGGHLKFDYNMNHIMGRQETKALDRDVDGIFNHTVNPEVALVERAEDARRVAREIRKVQAQNEKTPQGSTIKGVLSLYDFVPDHQEEKMRKIQGIRELFTDALVHRMPARDKKSYEEFQPMLSPGRVTLSMLPEQIVAKFRDREGIAGRQVFIFPNFDISAGDKFMRFVEEIRSVTCPECQGHFYASGETSVFYEIVKMLFREGPYVIAFAVGTIFLALWINFRTLKSTLVVFAPLAMGLLATLGWMGLTGIPFNIINMAALPIILGTADDYTVHFYQRYLDFKKVGKSAQEAYQRSFRPIMGSAITTLLGFGSLLFADMGGVRSFGQLCVVGISLCTVMTLVWFPGVLKSVTPFPLMVKSYTTGKEEKNNGRDR